MKIENIHQVENVCPFIHSPLKEDFGEYGEGPGTQQVLNGTYYIPGEFVEYMASFIEACKMREGLRIRQHLKGPQMNLSQHGANIKRKQLAKDLILVTL